jgi:predicted peroxiredoxin
VKFLYIATAGASDPTKASIPFHLAVNGSLEAGQQVAIALAGDAVEVFLADHRDTLAGVGVPPLAELLEKVRKNAVPVYV